MKLKLVTRILKDIKKYKKLNLILSGGKSPLKYYRFIFSQKLNWKDVSLFLLDERLATTRNKDSNFNNINKILESNGISNKIKPINQIYLKKKKIKSLIKNLKKRFTILILGMGNDGHFASIFNESKNYNLLTDVSQTPNFCKVESIGSPKLKRITMNLSMILLSSKIYLILNNNRKINLYKKAQKLKNANKYAICSLIKHFNKITIV